VHRPLFTLGACLAVVMSISPAPVQAAESAALIGPEVMSRSPRISLASVFEQAIEQAPESVLLQSADEQARAMQALARRWIVGAPSWQTSIVDDRLQTDQGLRELETGLAFDLWLPGQRRDARALGEAYNQRSAAWQRWLKWLIAGRLRTAMAEMETADLALESATEIAQQAERLLDSTRRLQRAGAASELEVIQAETLWLQRQREQMEAATARVNAEREWQQLTGLNVRPDTHRETPSTLETVPADHPLLALRQSELAIGDGAILAAEREARGSPNLSVGLRRERGDWQQPYINSAAISISIPISSRAVVNAAGSEARAARNESELARIQDLRELNTLLQQTQRELASVNAALPMAQREAELGQRQQQMAQTAFETGEIDLPEVILILQRAYESTLAYQQMLLRQRHLESEYNQIVGVLP